MKLHEDAINVNERFYNRLILFFVFPILIIYSVVFAYERLYGDSAGYLFQLIHHGTFNIAHNRPSSVFVEWLPLLMVKLDIPLKYILYGFSVAEFAYFFAWYFVFSKGFKTPVYGVAVILTYLFGLRWNYFNPVSELILAFPFMFLLVKLWSDKPKNTMVWYGVSLAASVFILLSHPLYIILLPAVLGYFIISHYKERRFIYLGIGILVLLGVNYMLWAGYNKMSVETVQQQLKLPEMAKRFISLKSITDLVMAYAGTLFLFALLVYSLYKRGYRVLPVFVLAFCIGYTGLVFYKYGNCYPVTYEPFERYLFILPIFICLLAIPYLLTTGKKARYIITGLVCWHLVYLGLYGVHVKHRYSVFARAIDNARQFGTNKVYYRAENYYCYPATAREHGHDWIMPVESLLLTSAEDKNNTMQVFVKEIMPEEFYKQAAPDNYIYDVGQWLGNIKELNPRYMNMKLGNWVEANTDSVQIFDPLKIKYDIPNICRSIHVNQEIKLTINLSNSGAPLYSGMKSQHRGLGYKWDNNERGTYITPLMCDLYSDIKQEIIIRGPKNTGEHTLYIGYMAEKPDTFIPFGRVNNIGYYIEAYE